MSGERRQISRRRFLQAASAIGASLAIGDAIAQDFGNMSGQKSSDQGKSAAPAGSPFLAIVESGRIVSLKRDRDRFDTDYIRTGARLGNFEVRYRHAGQGEWQSVECDSPQPPDKSPAPLTLESRFAFQGPALFWTLSVTNAAGAPIEIGDLAVPLPIGNTFVRDQPATARVLKHSLISGHGSHLFWMRSNSVGPYLTLIPIDGTHLEYWDVSREGYRVYVHSAAASAEAKAKGCRWRQPNTSALLEPSAQKSYRFRFDWAESYDSVRGLLVDNGLIDVQVVPGMTVPSDLFARFALRTRQTIHSVEAEFPDDTQIEYLGNTNGEYRIYQARFARLGENEITIRYGDGRRMFLEFFSTEPLETLIEKRAAFVAAHQFRDPSKWYDGLLAEWNMQDRVMPGPDNYDQIRGWRIYEVTCDDPGLSRPAYLAAKNAEFPVQAEIEALDYYIEHFVWGGLQRTTEESYSYAIYGIPDWKTNRESDDPGQNGRQHFWRCYDYPHIILMYFALYRVAKDYPHIKTSLSAGEYLRRAAGTALALFTVPLEIADWSAYETGFYNELVIVDLIRELETNNMAREASELRGHWERKVRYFVAGAPDLFGSEYPFDSTGFESTHALAKYALSHFSELGIPKEKAAEFLEVQMAANIFCRGWLETAYYLLGSDYRASGGSSYTLSYMSQMGGWAVMDYGLNYASDPYPSLRLGYASYLSAWALVNSGSRQSEYGYWFPGEQNDGGAGGGFEPAPYGETWLGQPHHRGSWYYSCEINLGYCGALRSAATVLADDPIFGRFCYGGTWGQGEQGAEIVPRDGVRRRFHALFADGRLSVEIEGARFAAGDPITLDEDISKLRFQLESDNPASHYARLRFLTSVAGTYRVFGAEGEIARTVIQRSQEVVFDLPIEAGGKSQRFTIERLVSGGH